MLKKLTDCDIVNQQINFIYMINNELYGFCCIVRVVQNNCYNYITAD